MACNLPGPWICLARPPLSSIGTGPGDRKNGIRLPGEMGRVGRRSHTADKTGPSPPPHPSTARADSGFRANRQKQLHLVCNEILTSKG